MRPRRVDYGRLEAAFLARRQVNPAAALEVVAQVVLGVEIQDVLRAFSLELARSGDPLAAIRAAGIQAAHGDARQAAALPYLEAAARSEGITVGRLLSRRKDRATSAARRLAVCAMDRDGFTGRQISVALNVGDAAVSKVLARARAPVTDIGMRRAA